MATDLERLVVQLEANMRNFEKSMDRAHAKANGSARKIERRFDRANRKLSRGFQQMGAAGVKALGAIGLAVGGAQLANLTAGALRAAESIQDMGRRAGVSAEFLQEMRFAADQNGASARDFDDAISRLNRRLGLFIADGGGPAAKAFESLGLEARIASGELSDAESVFNAVVRELQNVESAAERSAIASQLFGEDSGPRLAQMLSLGTEGLEAFSRRAREAGLVLENELVSNGAEVNAMLRAMRAEMGSEFNRAILKNADAIATMAESLAGLVSGFLNAIGAAHRLGIEVRKLIDLDPERARRSAQFRGAAGRIQDAGSDLMVGEFRNILRDELGREEANRFLNMIGFTSRRYTASTQDALAGFSTSQGEGLAAVVDLLEGFADGAETMEKLNEELKDVEVPEILGGGRGSGSGSGDALDPLPSPQFVPERPDLPFVAGEPVTIEVETDPDVEEMVKEFRRRLEWGVQSGLRAAFEGDFLDFALRNFQNAIFESVAQGIAKAIAEEFAGSAFGSIFSAIFSGSFGGGKAAGGPVRGGYAYRVGERGPETIIPAQNGMVLPNGATQPMRGQGGGVTVVNQFHLHAEGAVMTDELLREMDAKAETAGRTAVAVSRNDLASIRKRNSRRLG